MLISDCPELLPDFLGCEIHPRPASLSPAQSRLFALLGGTSPLACPWEKDGLEEMDVWVIRNASQSQFDVLRQRPVECAVLERPLLVHAVEGRGFHGQRGRPWSAVPGNLHLSCVFPIHQEPRHAPLLNAVPVLATADAVETYSSGRALSSIKWINDNLLGGKKFAGSIAASSIRGDRITEVIFGTGINVVATPDVARTPVAPGITSIRDAVAASLPPPGELLVAYLQAVVSWLGQWSQGDYAALLTAYRKACSTVGKDVVIGEIPEGKGGSPPSWNILAKGRVTGIDNQLALELDGCPEPISRGRILDPDGMV